MNYYYLASTYGSGNFDASTYNGATTSSSTGSSGVLTNTGFDIAAIVAVAALILTVTMIVRVWRRPGKAKG